MSKFYDGDLKMIVDEEDSLICPQCKEESNEFPRITHLEECDDLDERGKYIWWYQCPICNYIEEIDEDPSEDDAYDQDGEMDKDDGSNFI